VANKPFDYSWKNIAAMAAGLGAFAFGLGALETDLAFGSGMAIAAALVALGFGTYMRSVQRGIKNPN
jgi:multisubunit Na+/H+ antiporter MnhB subunit